MRRPWFIRSSPATTPLRRCAMPRNPVFALLDELVPDLLTAGPGDSSPRFVPNESSEPCALCESGTPHSFKRHAAEIRVMLQACSTHDWSKAYRNAAGEVVRHCVRCS